MLLGIPFHFQYDICYNHPRFGTKLFIICLCLKHRHMYGNLCNISYAFQLKYLSDHIQQIYPKLIIYCLAGMDSKTSKAIVIMLRLSFICLPSVLPSLVDKYQHNINLKQTGRKCSPELLVLRDVILCLSDENIGIRDNL